MSKNKIYTILFCCGVLAIVIVLLLVLLLRDQNNNLDMTINKSLFGKVDDVSIPVGNKIYDYYQLMDDSAELTIEVDKEGIINIDEEMIEGLHIGEVNVTLKAKTATKSSSTKFKVIVYKNDYTFNFIPLDGCTFENDNFYANKNTFQFKIEIIDKSNVMLENVSINIISNDAETTIKKSFSTIMIVANKNCVLTFIFPDLSTTFDKNVVLTN